MNPLPHNTGPSFGPRLGQTAPAPDDPWVEHLGWVRRLALRLARDEAAADDLVQRTALVALRHRQAVLAAEAGGGVRGWLRRVLYHEARSGWRRDRNRRAREGDYASASALGGEAPGEAPGEALERAEVSLEFTKRLVVAVEELDESYRAVVVARYFHGQSTAEISASVGAPVRTVETRLRRAREKMREALGRGDHGGGSSMGAWAPMVLVTWGGEDLGGLVASGSAAAAAAAPAAAKAAATNSVAAKWGAGLLAGMIAMNMKVVLGGALALAACLVGALRWGALDQSVAAPIVERASEPDALGPDLKMVASTAGRTPTDSAVNLPALDDAQEVASQDPNFVTLIEALPPGTLDVWVVDGDSQPVIGAKVLVAEGMVYTGWAPPEVKEDTPRQVQSVGSDPSEPVRFEGLGANRYFVEVTSPSGAKRTESVKLDPKYGSTAIMRFGSARVFGRVSDEAGTPIQGAYVRLGSESSLALTDQQKAIGRPLVWAVKESSDAQMVTDENGEFSFLDVPAGQGSLHLDGTVMDWEAGTQTTIPARYLSFELAPGEQHRVDFPPDVSSGGAIWRGRVVDVLGNPVATPDFSRRQAALRVASWGMEVPEKSVEYGARGDADFYLISQYALDGSFELRLPPGRYDAWVSSPHLQDLQHVLEAKDFLVSTGDVVTRDLVLPGITVHGESDEALAGDLRIWTDAKMYGSESVAISARPPGVTHSAGILHGGVQASGIFTLYGLEPGEWIFSALGKKAGVELTIPEGVDEVRTVLLKK